jgi:glycosyltransferase involved in cell wall biosynthesis
MTPYRPRIGIYDPFVPGLGGLYRYVQGVVSGLDPERFDVTVFCHPNRPYGSPRGIRMIPVHPYEGFPAVSNEVSAHEAGRLNSADNGHQLSRAELTQLLPKSARVVMGFTRSAVRIARLFRSHRFDLLHTFETDSDPATLAARMARVPRVLYTYQVDSTYREAAERWCVGNRLTEMITDRCLTVGIAASEQTRRDRLTRTHVGSGRIVTIPNGIDTVRYVRTMNRAEARKLTGLPDDGRTLIGTLGRLHPHKGQEYLIQAVAALGRQDVLAVIAGSGLLDDELRQLAARLGVTSQIAFLGQRSDVLELLQAFDLFALPSVCEALPYALLEAMSVGVPSVATDVGGVAELVEQGVSGLVVPPRDVPALTFALRRLLDATVAERDRMAAAARRRVVTQFHEPDLVRRTVDLYDTVLGRGVVSNAPLREGCE